MEHMTEQPEKPVQLVPLSHYQVLGVPFDAPLDTIRRAWLLKIRSAHPDRHADASVEVKAEMQRRSAVLNSAWTVLQDENRRLEYDLETGQRPARCSACGQPGKLRRGAQGGVVAACDVCWVPRPRRSTTT